MKIYDDSKRTITIVENNKNLLQFSNQLSKFCFARIKVFLGNDFSKGTKRNFNLENVEECGDGLSIDPKKEDNPINIDLS